eukprot:CAMPEP_0172761914 /NCGR_PEP_ID=MMETSP1074-20121228/172463_1 /TAXON_ID=2916 /ORGANISM="Ceratium fusus, Strain PA161109" /LENGTH=119 /DNA_ID=CAMNT_0013596215 /DNA_START=212 /DNA_END=571 /DNA_ORIENTATION=-
MLDTQCPLLVKQCCDPFHLLAEFQRMRFMRRLALSPVVPQLFAVLYQTCITKLFRPGLSISSFLRCLANVQHQAAFHHSELFQSPLIVDLAGRPHSLQPFSEAPSLLHELLQPASLVLL